MSCGFKNEALGLFDVPITNKVNSLGGYGPQGEVIYTDHPYGCPSVLTDTVGEAEATFMSTGSVGFHVKLPNGLDVHVLDNSFDNVEKREISVPSQNLWLDVADGRARRITSLINTNIESQGQPEAIRLLKMGDPARAMWYGARFTFGSLSYETAVRFALADTKSGPALTREVMIRNTGRKRLSANLWAYWNLHGTQCFVYNKELWYDAGLPLTNKETVIAATVPYSDVLQIKRVSGMTSNMKAAAATCDYASFVGNTAAISMMPDAVKNGALLKAGIHRKMNRFASPVIAANQYQLNVAPGRTATLQQTLLYVLDDSLIQKFRRTSGADEPTYTAMSAAFRKASTDLVKRTPDPKKVVSMTYLGAKKETHPDFAVSFPHQPVVAEYANSAWTTVEELYENCRAHGANLADGIELGTRDRGQDMWPKMKQDPGRVRKDLVHAMSFLYRTVDKTPVAGRKRLTRREKLHGMFPRQFPSRWDKREQEVMNDNRPYTDSPVWLIDSINRYVRETGDSSILSVKVKSVCLTTPETPETSGMIGCKSEFTIAEVIREIFACFERHAADSPYGLAQVMYGDWCDPVDMFGTARLGDPSTRGKGRGSHIRLSAHVATTLIDTIDLFSSCGKKLLSPKVVTSWKSFASTLRKNIVKWGWEDTGRKGFHAGFINVIHEYRKNGTKPNYSKGETGYTLGSMTGRDYDGICRRELLSQAYNLHLLGIERDYLEPVKEAKQMRRALMQTVDTMLFDRKIGLSLFSVPMANNKRSRDLVGRMGIVPSGCAENGEYHHAQAMMHFFRMGIPGQVNTVWKQLMPMLSASRDASIAGPFETPCTSYVSDLTDPHFGKAFYFGLSGSIDWLVDVFQKMAGVTLSLHDPKLPDIAVSPQLSTVLKDKMTFRRLIHRASGKGKYTVIPLTVRIKPCGSRPAGIFVNGKQQKEAVIHDLKKMKRVEIEIRR